MADQRIKIPRASDRVLFDCYKEIHANHGGDTCNINALGFTRIDPFSFGGEIPPGLDTLLKKNSAIIDSASMRVGDLTLSFHRGGNCPVQDKSAIWDEISINQNANQPEKLSEVSKIEIVSLINKKLNAFDPKKSIGGKLSPEQAQLEAMHTTTLERLETLNEDLIRQSSDFRENLERKYDEKAEVLEAEISRKEESLDSEYKKKEERLDQQEEVLNAKLKEIDNRNNTHVRREIRDRMLDDVKSRIDNFGVSQATERKRQPVATGMLFLMIVLACSLAFTGYEIWVAEVNSAHAIQSVASLGAKGVTNNEAINSLIADASVNDHGKIYWLWGRFALFSFTLLGSILYYIKWQNRWAEQHANSEFQLQQFYIDVNRANWVIESCLEWRKETQSAIPTDLLKSITNNLFVNDQNDLERVMHPSDELASALLGSASKLKMKVGDSDLEFDKPSKIAKKVVPAKADS